MKAPQQLMSDFAAETSRDSAALVPGVAVTRSRRFKWALALVAVVCVVVVGVTIGWFLIHQRGRNDAGTGSSAAAHETEVNTEQPPPAHGPICKTAECQRQAADVIKQINKAADPCDNFYEFACGGWMRRNPLTANESSVSGFSVLNDDNMKVLKSALENAATNYSKNAAVMKAAKYYKACVNTTAVESATTAPLLELVRTLGGWSALSSRPNNLSVPVLIGRVARELNVDTFLGVKVSVDMEDNTRHIVKLTPASLGMSYENYVTYSSENPKIREAYKTYMKKIAKLLGGGPDSDAKMMKIYDFEKKLALIADNKDPNLNLVEQLEDLRRSGRSLLGIDTTISEFSYKSGFPEAFILDFLNEAFRGIKMFGSYHRIQASPDWYFKKLGSFYSVLSYPWTPGDVDTLKDYVIWRMVDHYVTAMPSRFTGAKRKFMEAMLGPRSSPRWEGCVQEMMTPLDMPLGLLFVDSHFKDDSKKTVVDMTRRIRTAFVDNLRNADWMDQETKDAAREKALAILEDIGYPPWIKDPSQLSQAYSVFQVTEGNYFESFKALNSFARLKAFQDVDKTVNKDKWMEGPAQVNGYYSPQQNRIVFLAGIIQSPFYFPKRPRYMNYGSIGMVIGHEITHGFDGTGRLFDKDGNVKDWWSFSSELSFESRTQCLVDQYSRYRVFGENIDGKQTLNENIADNGGIKLAYEAYQAWVRDNKPEGRLPGLGLSVEQLFFVGFARPWCSICKREAALLQLRVDSHTFNKYRIIGSLSNYDKFAEAFRCRRGTNMNPYTKCSVW